MARAQSQPTLRQRDRLGKRPGLLGISANSHEPCHADGRTTRFLNTAEYPGSGLTDVLVTRTVGVIPRSIIMKTIAPSHSPYTSTPTCHLHRAHSPNHPNSHMGHKSSLGASSAAHFPPKCAAWHPNSPAHSANCAWQCDDTGRVSANTYYSQNGSPKISSEKISFRDWFVG
ncbi:unnamed protein product [Rodentolepis nana]|uniref:Uncharacterized protein n=1 Tax=Rodentolepis nana TaxID=102285 RepID=A0A0R3TMS7_RODNA|nr:unnamed protein product [Rodentolepis nana]